MGEHVNICLTRLPAIVLGLVALLVISPIVAAATPPANPGNPAEPATERTLHLEAIEVTGNHHTSEHIILRYITIEPGDEVNVDVLETNRQRLLATDYFTSVEFSTRPGSVRGAVVLVIEVKERGFPSFETGFGYDDLYGWFLTLLGLRFDNTLGIESQFRMGLRFGFRIAGVDAEWSKPIPPDGGFGYAARFHIYNQSHLFYGSGPEGTDPWQGTQWKRFRQDIARAGAEAALRYRYGGATRFSIGIQVEANKPDSAFTDPEKDKEFNFDALPEEIQNDLGRNTTTGFFFRVLRDTRDFGDFPLSGSFTRLTLEFNNSFLGGDHIFSKATGDYRKHFALGKKTVISSRLSGGIISSGAPYYERFYLGGNYSIRGFAEWSLSPAVGDDAYWLTNIELRTPLIDSRRGQPKLTGLLFIDAGQGWQRGTDFSIDDVESAIGWGLRLRLPWVGTFGMDVGIPLSEGRTGDEFRVHGLLGFSF
ncbi:MAG: BamA/TamA family outer membrane protein [Candidatus Latescibacterota bacterium]|nr:MAG: BamA/TamA family outer membrane protein [Candidatus Latescibacterota bacterium]